MHTYCDIFGNAKRKRATKKTHTHTHTSTKRILGLNTQKVFNWKKKKAADSQLAVVFFSVPFIGFSALYYSCRNLYTFIFSSYCFSNCIENKTKCRLIRKKKKIELNNLNFRQLLLFKINFFLSVFPFIADHRLWTVYFNEAPANFLWFRSILKIYKCTNN